MSDPIDVIVVTYNSRACFARQKAALESQTHPYRLIVVDNASAPDQRPTPADFPPGAEIVQMDTNTGFASANNRAVEQGSGPLFALLNPDAFPEPDWLENLVRAAEQHPRAASFGSTQISAENPLEFDGLGDCYHVFGIPWRGGYGWPRTTPARTGEPFTVCAAAALYRRDAWRAIGGFDESFFCYCEDVDLGFRLRLMGWRAVQVADAVVRHVGGASSRTVSDFAAYHGARNRLRTFVKDMPGLSFWLFLPAHALVTMYLLMRAQRTPALHAATLRGVKDALAGRKALWRQRRDVQRARTAPAWRILAAMAWSPAAVSRRAPVLR